MLAEKGKIKVPWLVIRLLSWLRDDDDDDDDVPHCILSNFAPGLCADSLKDDHDNDDDDDDDDERSEDDGKNGEGASSSTRRESRRRRPTGGAKEPSRLLLCSAAAALSFVPLAQLGGDSVLATRRLFLRSLEERRRLLGGGREVGVLLRVEDLAAVLDRARRRAQGRAGGDRRMDRRRHALAG